MKTLFKISINTVKYDATKASPVNNVVGQNKNNSEFYLIKFNYHESGLPVHRIDAEVEQYCFFKLGGNGSARQTARTFKLTTPSSYCIAYNLGIQNFGLTDKLAQIGVYEGTTPYWHIDSIGTGWGYTDVYAGQNFGTFDNISTYPEMYAGANGKVEVSSSIYTASSKRPTPIKADTIYLDDMYDLFDHDMDTSILYKQYDLIKNKYDPTAKLVYDGALIYNFTIKVNNSDKKDVYNNFIIDHPDNIQVELDFSDSQMSFFNKYYKKISIIDENGDAITPLFNLEKRVNITIPKLSFSNYIPRELFIKFSNLTDNKVRLLPLDIILNIDTYYSFISNIHLTYKP